MPRRRLLTQPLQPSLLLQLPTRRSPPKSRDREYITRRTSPGRTGVSIIRMPRVTARVARVTTYRVRIFRADMLASGKAQVLPPPNNCPIRIFTSQVVYSFWSVHGIRPQIFLPIIVPLLVGPTLAAEFTYKEYAKASENWKRGFVFGISRYMTAVAQPDKSPPSQLGWLFRDASATQPTASLSSRLEGYVKAHPDNSNGPMTAVVVRALFDCVEPKSQKLEHPRPCLARGELQDCAHQSSAAGFMYVMRRASKRNFSRPKPKS